MIPGSDLDDGTMCASCESWRIERTGKQRDGIAWWLTFKCADCGATGEVENRHSGTSRYHGQITTARRLDRAEREAFAAGRDQR